MKELYSYTNRFEKKLYNLANTKLVTITSHLCGLLIPILLLTNLIIGVYTYYAGNYILNPFFFHSPFDFVGLKSTYFILLCIIGIAAVNSSLLIRVAYSLIWGVCFWKLTGNVQLGDPGQYMAFIRNGYLNPEWSPSLTVRAMSALLALCGKNGEGISLALSGLGALYIFASMGLARAIAPFRFWRTAFFLLQIGSGATLTFFRDGEIYSLSTLMSVLIVWQLLICFRNDSVGSSTTKLRIPEVCLSISLCFGVCCHYINFIYLPAYLFLFVRSRRHETLLIHCVISVISVSFLYLVFNYNPLAPRTLDGGLDQDNFITLFTSWISTPLELAWFSAQYHFERCFSLLMMVPSFFLFSIIWIYQSTNNHRLDNEILTIVAPSFLFINIYNFDLGLYQDSNLFNLSALGANVAFIKISSECKPIRHTPAKLSIIFILIASCFLMFQNIMTRHEFYNKDFSYFELHDGRTLNKVINRTTEGQIAWCTLTSHLSTFKVTIESNFFENTSGEAYHQFPIIKLFIDGEIFDIFTIDSSMTKLFQSKEFSNTYGSKHEIELVYANYYNGAKFTDKGVTVTSILVD